MRWPGDPGDDPYVIAVAGAEVDETGVRAAEWTSSGDGVRNPDLAAPGTSIHSLRAPGSDADVNHPEGYVDAETFKGTGSSQSAAAVAGAAALLLDARPELTNDQVKALLVDSATPLADPATLVGSGLVNVAAANSLAAPAVSRPGYGPLTDRRRSPAVAALVDVPVASRSVAARSRWQSARGRPRIGSRRSGSRSEWQSASWQSAKWQSVSWQSASGSRRVAVREAWQSGEVAVGAVGSRSAGSPRSWQAANWQSVRTGSRYAGSRRSGSRCSWQSVQSGSPRSGSRRSGSPRVAVREVAVREWQSAKWQSASGSPRAGPEQVRAQEGSTSPIDPGARYRCRSLDEGAAG